MSDYQQRLREAKAKKRLVTRHPNEWTADEALDELEVWAIFQGAQDHSVIANYFAAIRSELAAARGEKATVGWRVRDDEDGMYVVRVNGDADVDWWHTPEHAGARIAPLPRRDAVKLLRAARKALPWANRLRLVRVTRKRGR